MRLTLRAEDENLIADMLCYELVASKTTTKYGPLLVFAVDGNGEPVLVSKKMLVTSLKITDHEITT